MISLAISDGASAAFDALGGRLREEVRGGLGRAAALLQAEVQARLSGQVLGVKGGRLRQSIVVTAPAGDDDAMSIGVSSDVPYAAIHEYGFRGSETVRAHVRRITEAFGRPIRARAIDVRPYNRAVDFPERSFLRAALRDLEASGAIRAEIDAAIGRATA